MGGRLGAQDARGIHHEGAKLPAAEQVAGLLPPRSVIERGFAQAGRFHRLI